MNGCGERWRAQGKTRREGSKERKKENRKRKIMKRGCKAWKERTSQITSRIEGERWREDEMEEGNGEKQLG